MKVTVHVSYSISLDVDPKVALVLSDVEARALIRRHEDPDAPVKLLSVNLAGHGLTGSFVTMKKDGTPSKQQRNLAVWSGDQADALLRKLGYGSIRSTVHAAFDQAEMAAHDPIYTAAMRFERTEEKP